MRQLKRDECGVGTIELALIVPVLILLTVCFLDLARALNAAIVVGGASQEGAHYAVLNPAAAPSAIASAARARVQPLSPGSVTVTADGAGRLRGAASRRPASRGGQRPEAVAVWPGEGKAGACKA